MGGVLSYLEAPTRQAFQYLTKILLLWNIFSSGLYVFVKNISYIRGAQYIDHDLPVDRKVLWVDLIALKKIDVSLSL